MSKFQNLKKLLGGCGHGIFEKHNVKKKMHEYVKRIHVHGCIAAMEYTLKV